MQRGVSPSSLPQSSTGRFDFNSVLAYLIFDIHALVQQDRGNCADRALAGIALLAIARGDRRSESAL